MTLIRCNINPDTVGNIGQGSNETHPCPLREAFRSHHSSTRRLCVVTTGAGLVDIEVMCGMLFLGRGYLVSVEVLLGSLRNDLIYNPIDESKSLNECVNHGQY